MTPTWTTGDVVVLSIIYLFAFPLPLFALFGIMNQRKQLRQERVNFATIKRISGGWGRR